MKPTLKQSIRGHARRFLAPLFLRDANSKLAASRAFGSSWEVRSPVIAGIMRARTAMPRALVAYTPPIPKIAKIAAPGVFRRRPAKPALRPCKAEVERVITASNERHYIRLSSGQIVKAFRRDLAVKGSLVAHTPGGRVTLRPADLKHLPQTRLAHV